MDLQIENKLLSAGIDTVSVHCGTPKNQYSPPFKKKIGSGLHPSGSHLGSPGINGDSYIIVTEGNLS